MQLDETTLAGRVAVVTGASRGIGAGLVERFAARGLRVGAFARSLPEMPDGDHVAAAVDVTDAAAVAGFLDEVVDRLGPIDLWVNNAGLLEPIGPLRDLDLDALDQLLAVNVRGVLVGSQAFVRHRRQVGGGGTLVNISSGAAKAGRAGWAGYCASKAAVDRITESVWLEERDQGLRALAVAPGVVETDMQVTIRATGADRFPDVQGFLELRQAGRMNSTEFVADHLLDLAFREAEPDDLVLRLPNEWEQRS